MSYPCLLPLVTDADNVVRLSFVGSLEGATANSSMGSSNCIVPKIQMEPVGCWQDAQPMLQRTSSQRFPPKTARSSMPGSLLTGLGLLLTFSALDPVFAQPRPQPIHRIIVGEISRGCSRDGESTRTVMSRLRQGGVNVDGTRLDARSALARIVPRSSRDREGYLLGGDVRKGESTLWLVDEDRPDPHSATPLEWGSGAGCPRKTGRCLAGCAARSAYPVDSPQGAFRCAARTCPMCLLRRLPSRPSPGAQ